MKYTNEIVKKIVEDYNAGVDVKMIASNLTKEMGQVVPERSVIAKLSSLGVYKRKVYTSKTGSAPIKKEEYIAKISKILKIDIDLLESLEKVTKTALMLIVDRLEK
jgi:hypothetical protein